MSKRLLILGSGGHASVVIDVIEKMISVEIEGVFDDYVEPGKNILDYAVQGGIEQLAEKAQALDVRFIIAIGDNKVRRQLFESLKKQKLCAGLVQHPSVVLGKNVTIGEGCMLIANATVNPGSRVGCNTIINTGAVVDHDCIIGDHVHIAPNATLCGNVSVGENTWVGAGATVIEGITIGKNSLIAAGAVVISNVPDNAMVGGVPARPLLTSMTK